MTKRVDPIEEAFNLAPTSLSSGTYDATYVPEPTVDNSNLPIPVDQSIPPPKDSDDQEIINKLEDIHEKAMAAFNNQTEMVEIVDPKYAARNAEVANLYLTSALNAVNLLAKVKSEREKRRDKNSPQTPQTVNNNLVLTDRNAILQMIMGEKKDENQ